MSDELVQTSAGLIPRDQLEIKDFVEWHENARVKITAWFYQGEEVKRSVHVEVLRGVAAALTQSQE